MKRLSWLLTLPLAVVIVIFALSNRAGVKIGLWPTDFAPSVPIFLLPLGGLVVGFIVGAAAMWVGSLRWRRQARRQAARAAELERELAKIRRIAAETAARPETAQPQEKTPAPDRAEGGRRMPAAG